MDCEQTISAIRVSEVDQIRDDVSQLCLAIAVGLPDEEAVTSLTGIAVRVLVVVGSGAKVREDDIFPWHVEVGWAVELGLVQSGSVLFLPEETQLIEASAGQPCVHGVLIGLAVIAVAVLAVVRCES